MADSVALHSRVVFLLKIVLPLAALAILSTLFLLARGPAPDGSIPFSDVDLKGLAEEPRITRPEYSGMTSDGASLTVTAAEARPGKSGGPASAKELTVTYDRPDGLKATATAQAGSLHMGSSTLDLTGNVILTTSSGYTLRSEKLTAELSRTVLRSDGPVTADGPLGSVTAGAMVLDGGAEGGSHHVLTFNKHVRLVYDPAKPAPTSGP